MIKSSLVFLLLFHSTGATWAFTEEITAFRAADLPNREPRRGKVEPQPLPEVEIQNVDLPSIDSIFRQIFISYPYESRFDFVETGVDLLKKEMDLHADVLLSKELKSKRELLSFKFNRYEINDSRTIDRLIEFADAGIGEVIVNTFLVNYVQGKYDLSSPEKFKGFKFKATPSAAALNRLRKAGFLFVGADISYEEAMNLKGPRRLIVSAPPGPLMHDKFATTTLLGANGEYSEGLLATVGTQNHTLPPKHKKNSQGEVTTLSRFNRMFSINFGPYIQIYDQRQRDQIEAFGQGKAIADIPERKLARLVAKDGSYVEPAFPGRSNANDRVDADLKEALADPENVRIDHLVLSHFVATYKPFLESLRKYLDINKQLNVIGIFANKFSEILGYGYPTALEGVRVTPPFGGGIAGFGRFLRNRISAFVVQRQVEGNPIKRLDGPPQEYTHHDKFTGLKKAYSNGLSVYKFFVGSFNFSGAFQNSEHQDMIQMNEGSEVAKALMESVIKPLRQGKREGFVVPAVPATVRDAIADMTGRTFLEVTFEEVQDFELAIEQSREDRNDMRRVLNLGITSTQAIDKRLDGKASPALKRALKRARPRFENFEDLMGQLKKISKRETTLEEPISQKEIGKYLGKFKRNYFWLVTVRSEYWSLDAETVLSYVVPLTLGDDAYLLKKLIVSAIYDRSLTFEQLEVKAREEWKKLGIELEFPVYKPKARPEVKTEATGGWKRFKKSCQDLLDGILGGRAA